jgi:hypothetical protein
MKAERASNPKHSVRVDGPLAEIAREYSGSASGPCKRVSYAANKGTVGKNPCTIRPGIVLSIPELPPSLKKRSPTYAANRHPDLTALRVHGRGMVWEPYLGRPAQSGRKP